MLEEAKQKRSDQSWLLQALEENHVRAFTYVTYVHEFLDLSQHQIFSWGHYQQLGGWGAIAGGLGVKLKQDRNLRRMVCCDDLWCNSCPKTLQIIRNHQSSTVCMSKLSDKDRFFYISKCFLLDLWTRCQVRSERCSLARTAAGRCCWRQLWFRCSNQPREIWDLESSITVPVTRYLRCSQRSWTTRLLLSFWHENGNCEATL